MSNNIHIFNKSTLASLDSQELVISGGNLITIRHDLGVEKEYFGLIPFIIEGTGANVGTPHGLKEEFMVVIRERVDLSASGPNDTIIKNVGKDIGQENYKDRMPYRPVHHDGFTVMRDPKNRKG